jgi:23S rRNA pseudouridine1911/1915/1917 synthase
MDLNQGYSYREVVGLSASGHSTLSYLATHFDHSTESQWQQRLDAGELTLEGNVAGGAESLSPGKILVWNRPGWLEPDTPRDYTVLYRDQDLLAVDKPSGLPTIPGAGFFQNTLLSLVQLDYPEARPLHRLGRATSGLVLFALNGQSAAALSRNWPQVQKQYQALGSLVASQDTYDIQSPIGEHEHPALGKVHAANPSGKASRSVARVLERRSNSTVFEVDLHTGRPHQIRIHLAFIGHPLVGDPLYATGGLPRIDQPGLPGDSGYWLHAKRLRFEHPVTRESIVVNSPTPKILRTH